MTKLSALTLIAATTVLGSCITVTPTPKEMAKVQTSTVIRKIIPQKEAKPRVVIPAAYNSQHEMAIRTACDAVQPNSQGQKRVIIVKEGTAEPTIIDCPATNFAQGDRTIKVSIDGGPAQIFTVREDGQTIPISTTRQSVGSQIHTVKSGDNLWQISRRYCGTLEELMDANGLSQHSILQPGQRLNLPPQTCK